MKERAYPRRAARDPLQGAAPAARQSRFRGVCGSPVACLEYFK